MSKERLTVERLEQRHWDLKQNSDLLNHTPKEIASYREGLNDCADMMIPIIQLLLDDHGDCIQCIEARLVGFTICGDCSCT